MGIDSFESILIIIVDVDGVLTDGKYNYSASQQDINDYYVSKSFYTRDFFALDKMHDLDYNIVVATSSSDNVIESKIYSNPNTDRSGWTVLSNVSDKVLDISQYLSNNGFDWDNVLYIGDAENDFFCLKKAAYAACPSDAIEEVIEISDFVSNFRGGNGAVYDILRCFSDAMGYEWF